MGAYKSNRAYDEVSFANHIFEFVRFYDNHRLFCDQIAGLKGQQSKLGESEEIIYIKPNNFILAIRKLSAFMIDNLHYVKDIYDARNLQKRVSDLEDDFNGNKKYQELVQDVTLNDSEEILLQRMYFKYLIECFDITNELVYLLQNSLMITTSDVKKYVSYHNSTQFFQNLSYYREEVANDLSRFSLKNTLDHVRKMLGYTNSYKMLLKEEERKLIVSIETSVLNYLYETQTLDNIRISLKPVRDSNLAMKLKEESKRIKYLLEMLYYITNKCLSERNVLPKIQRRIFIDKTLI